MNTPTQEADGAIRSIDHITREASYHDWCFTSGCFDLLHPGHLHLLHACKQHAFDNDLTLIVSVNSDESILKLKHRKPVMTLHDRLLMLANLPWFFRIVPFDDKTPKKLIQILKPKVILHGHSEDRPAWTDASELEGFEGEVICLPLLEDHSSTKLRERVYEVEAANVSFMTLEEFTDAPNQ